MKRVEIYRMKALQNQDFVLNFTICGEHSIFFPKSMSDFGSPELIKLCDGWTVSATFTV